MLRNGTYSSWYISMFHDKQFSSSSIDFTYINKRLQKWVNWGIRSILIYF